MMIWRQLSCLCSSSTYNRSFLSDGGTILGSAGDIIQERRIHAQSKDVYSDMGTGAGKSGLHPKGGIATISCMI